MAARHVHYRYTCLKNSTYYNADKPRNAYFMTKFPSGFF